MSLCLLSVFLLAVACQEPVDEDTPPPIPDGRDTGSDDEPCGEAVPAIRRFTVTPDGLQEFEEDQFYPTVRIELDLTDEDGDLTFLTWMLWWDDDLDGVVDTSGLVRADGQMSVDAAECEATAPTVYLLLGSAGDPAPGTWYDWAIQVLDREGHASEPAYTQGGVPEKDGSDPDPPDGDTGPADTSAR